MTTPRPIARSVRTPVLEIGYLESGPPDGAPVILLHGWPSDVHDWDAVAEGLAAAGCRVLVPWLRGFGPTRFLDPETPRSGQQAAVGADLRDFLDALGLPDALLTGYDWGGRAACVVAALWPERVRGLVTINGYAIQDIRGSIAPADALQEQRYWYQWYFHTSRGREGLMRDRRGIARLLWKLWSPNWAFTDAEFEATAQSFDNPDFVDITLQSYRHRYGNASGDPAYDELERLLAAQPSIPVPTVVLHGECDGVGPPVQSANAARHFSGPFERRVIPVAGHFLSRENPEEVVTAVRSLVKR
jgi:pimeloyl-ACP methyl ester carboxylesterase